MPSTLTVHGPRNHTNRKPIGFCTLPPFREQQKEPSLQPRLYFRLYELNRYFLLAHIARPMGTMMRASTQMTT